MSPYIIPGLKKALMLTQLTNNCDAIIIDTILDYREHSREKVLGKSRKRELVHTRRLLCWFLKKRTKLSLKDIGGLLGGRDHTTVIHSLQALQDLMDTEPEIRNEVNYLSEIFLK